MALLSLVLAPLYGVIRPVDAHVASESVNARILRDCHTNVSQA